MKEDFIVLKNMVNIFPMLPEFEQPRTTTDGMKLLKPYTKVPYISEHVL